MTLVGHSGERNPMSCVPSSSNLREFTPEPSPMIEEYTYNPKRLGLLKINIPECRSSAALIPNQRQANTMSKTDDLVGALERSYQPRKMNAKARTTKRDKKKVLAINMINFQRIREHGSTEQKDKPAEIEFREVFYQKLPAEKEAEGRNEML